jgi:hypothetical protein
MEIVGEASPSHAPLIKTRSLNKPVCLSLRFVKSSPVWSQRARPQPHVLLPGYHAVASLVPPAV